MMPEMASREPPVGSSDSDSYHDTIVLNQPKSGLSDPDQYRVKQLEEERDNLQKNMISLTSRLAQVPSVCSCSNRISKFSLDRIPNESSYRESKRRQG